jgi:hypothetical protein
MEYPHSILRMIATATAAPDGDLHHCLQGRMRSERGESEDTARMEDTHRTNLVFERQMAPLWDAGCIFVFETRD